MVLSYAFCNTSVAPIKAEPSHRSEMVTQLLFGEKAEILEINDNEWARVRGYWDEYIGWCKISQLTLIDHKDFRKQPKYIADKHNNRLIFEETDMWLPMGCDLFGLKHLPQKEGKYKGKKLTVSELELSPKKLVEVALQYMNAPYLWGGRTIAGIDCSGLTQIAFKLCGMSIRRDATQQAEEGEMVGFLQDATKGDLAFFDNAEGKITHVGLLIDNTHIIHATDTSGRVVVDKIDSEGIVSVQLKRRTHKLRMIRRYC